MNRARALLQQRDRGSISMLGIVMAFAVIIMIGLAVDGGGKTRALERADDIAAEAARTAGQAIDTAQAIQGGQKIIDPAAAVNAAQRYLTAAGVTGTVTVAADRTHVTVTVTVVYHTVFLPLIGVDHFTCTRSATATLLVT